MLLAPLEDWFWFRCKGKHFILWSENGVVRTCALERLSPILLAPGADFVEGNFSIDRVEGYVFRVTQVCYIYCALYFCCYYISSTSEHQTLDTCFRASGASRIAPMVKKLPANAGDLRDTGWTPGGEHCNPLQNSCLDNPVDRGSWWAMVHRVA